jgi:hypothetical protein
MNRKIISLAIATALTGCASTPVMETVDQAHSEAAAKVAALNAATDPANNAAILLPVQDVPYLPQKSVARGSFKAELPMALRSTKLVHLSTQQAVNVQQFARVLAEEFKLPVKVEADAAAQANAQAETTAQRVDLASMPPMPLRDLVTTVTRLLGTDWDWQDGTFLIQPQFTRTYAISTSPDANKGKVEIGKKGSSATGVASGGSGGSFNNEITSTTEHGTDAWKDLEASLKQIAGDKNVVIGKTFNMVTVTCAKSCHKIVKQFIDNANHQINQQVMFKVQEITVATTSTGESGIDWNLVYRTVLDTRNYRFALATPASIVSGAAGTIQNVLTPVGDGPVNGWDTSSFLFKAISTASKFVDVKPYSTIINNNETATLTNIEQQTYTQSFTVVPSTILGGQPTYVGNPGYATFGQIVSVRPTILPDGNIRVAFSLDDTSGKVNKGTGQGVIDNVLSNAINVNTKMTVKPGSTMILSSFKRTTNRTNNQGLFENQKMGSESGSHDTTETVILITPYIANVGAL